jgi:putative transposase
MARQLRLEFPGALYHITARGNARADIYSDDTDRQTFLALLGREIAQQGWQCYAYCLMTNHYHLLIETPEANLSGGMRRLNGVYTQSFNRRHGRVGHLLQGRYKSVVVEKESYLLEVCRYLVLNPVRAGLVGHARQWGWSSYRATAGYEEGPQWLEVSGIRGLFGGPVPQAMKAYRRFVQEGIGQGSMWEEVVGQIFLGSAVFLARMAGLVKGQSLDNVPAVQRRPTRLKPVEVLDRVGAVYGLSRWEILARVEAEAYWSGAYLLRRAANLPLKEVGGMFGVSASRISHIQRQMERKKLNKHEQELMRWCNVKQ